MAKRANLSAALHEASGKKAAAPEVPAQGTAPESTETTTVKKKTRDGKKVIAGYFDPAVSKQLKQLALEHDTTVQALLAEALDLLFIERGKPTIAGSDKG